MIALLFLLTLLAMVLITIDRVSVSYVLFAATLLLGIYWFHYHATSQLSIIL